MEKNFQSKILLCFFMFSVFGLFTSTVKIAYSQFGGLGNTSFDPITISQSPTNPGPLQEVTISIKSFNTDLNRANITWLEDGKPISQGIGITSVTVVSPALGEISSIDILVRTVEGAVYNRKITLRPADVDIIWEVDGYTHPFYEGKVPFSYQNTIKLVAIPHIVDEAGKKINPKNLVYQWKRDAGILQDQSGFGKQSILIKGAIVPRPFRVTVNVSSLDSKIQAVGIINLDTISPSISFYEADPLYGPLYNKALSGTFRVKNEETKIIAVPFGFNLENKNINYIWSINNEEKPELLEEKMVTLRAREGVEGSSIIQLDVRNLDDILQGARAGFSVFVSGRETQELEPIF